MTTTVIVDLATLPGGSDPTDIMLDVELGTGTDDLIVKYNDEPLPERESLLVIVPQSRTARLVVADFDDPSQVRWITSANPRINDLSSTWERVELAGTGTSVEVGPQRWPYPDFLPVTIEARTDGEQTRQKKIHIKIRTEDPQPGGLRHRG